MPGSEGNIRSTGTGRPGRIVLLAAFGVATLAEPAALRGRVSCGEASPGRNAVVHLVRVPGVRFEPPRDPVVMDQKNLLFRPHVLPVLLGTTVAFRNSDPIRHNVFSYSEPRMFNLGTYSPGVIPHVTFDRPGLVSLLCNVHPEMSAFILVLETPFFTTTDENGGYLLEGLPEGDFTVRAWAENCREGEVPVHLRGGEIQDLDFRLEARRKRGKEVMNPGDGDFGGGGTDPEERQPR